MRIAYVDFDGARVLAVARQMPLQKDLNADFIDTYCPNVINAVNLMCDWLAQ